MSWKHWTAVLVVIGGGILIQIPRHDMPVPDHRHGGAAIASTEPNSSGSAIGPYRTVGLEVTGMTCATCPVAARVAIKRVAGVKEAAFSWPAGTGSVTYDTTMTSPGAFIAELTRATGFGVTLLQE